MAQERIIIKGDKGSIFFEKDSADDGNYEISKELKLASDNNSLEFEGASISGDKGIKGQKGLKGLKGGTTFIEGDSGDKGIKGTTGPKGQKGGKGGKQGRIICSELYRQGLISKEDYVLDLYYTSKHLTSQHTAGYWHFAVPAVKAMRRSKFWTAFWREIAYNRLQDIKWRLGEGKFNLKGRIYSAIFEPVCYIGGYFKSNATYKELYEGDKQWQ